MFLPEMPLTARPGRLAVPQPWGLEASPGARPPLLAPLPSEHLLFSFGEMRRTEEPAVLHGVTPRGVQSMGSQ